jgi:hypothetical protein
MMLEPRFSTESKNRDPVVIFTRQLDQTIPPELLVMRQQPPIATHLSIYTRAIAQTLGYESITVSYDLPLEKDWLDRAASHFSQYNGCLVQTGQNSFELWRHVGK